MIRLLFPSSAFSPWREEGLEGGGGREADAWSPFWALSVSDLSDRHLGRSRGALSANSIVDSQSSSLS